MNALAILGVIIGIGLVLLGLAFIGGMHYAAMFAAGQVDYWREVGGPSLVGLIPVAIGILIIILAATHG